MNYIRHYNTLISRAKSRLIEGYVEKHHIIPKCLGGTDDSDNIVTLTPEEHYVAHQLLIKIYPNESKLIYSARMMCVGSKNHSRNNKEYAWLKRLFSQTRFGYKHSDDAKKKMSEAARKPRAKETKPRKKRILSEEHRQKISASLKGRIVTNETKERIRKSNILTKSHQDLSGKNSHMYGRTLSEETKKKISETKRKRSSLHSWYD